MTIRVLVMDEQPDAYDGKKGRVESWKLLCLDWSEGHRCKTMLEFSLPADQSAFKGSFKDGFADLTITEISAGFGGSMRVRGAIHPCKREPEPAAASQATGKGK